MATDNPETQEPADPDFEIIARVNSGLFGAVWKARQNSLNRDVAIKFIHPHMADIADVLEHARGLVKAGSHPNLVTVFCVTTLNHPDTHDLVNAIVMEWLEGESVGSRLGGPTLFQTDEAKGIIEGLCSGISHLHSNGVTHCDLHAGNIMLSNGIPKIIDIDYAAQRSLSLLTTQSREVRIQTDINAVANLAIVILKRSAMDAVAVARAEGDLRIASEIEVIRRVVQSLYDNLAFGPSARQSSLLDNDASRAIVAITQQRPDQASKVRAFFKSVITRLDALAPKCKSNVGFRDVLCTSLASTAGVVTEVAEVATEIGAMNSGVAARAAFKCLEKIVERHGPAKGATGMFFDADFDFYKFVGHELLVILVAALLSEDGLELIGEILNEELYRDGHGLTPGLVPYTDLSAYVETLAINHRNAQGAWPPIQSALLKERHSTGRLAVLCPFDAFMATDYLLHLRDAHWIPRSTAFLRTPPRFVVDAIRKTYATRLLAVVRDQNIDELQATIQARRKTLVELWGPHNFLDPLRGFDISQIGSR